jgi:hypothetical protein
VPKASTPAIVEAAAYQSRCFILDNRLPCSAQNFKSLNASVTKIIERSIIQQARALKQNTTQHNTTQHKVATSILQHEVATSVLPLFGPVRSRVLENNSLGERPIATSAANLISDIAQSTSTSNCEQQQKFK